jgi:hypothetical protein
MENERVVLHPFFALLLGKRVRNLKQADVPQLEILEKLIGSTRGAAGARNAWRWTAYCVGLTLAIALATHGGYGAGVAGVSLLCWTVWMFHRVGGIDRQ